MPVRSDRTRPDAAPDPVRDAGAIRPGDPTPESPSRPIRYGEQCLDASDVEAVRAVLASDWLTQGPAVAGFEDALARLSALDGAEHAAAVSNGTAALHLALLALDVGPGRRVLTSANTFLASATSALLAGAEVEFVDVDARTGNLDVRLLERRLASGPRVDAVVAVHFAGLPADMERLIGLAREHGFALVEDACHALGASYRAFGRDWRPGEHPDVAAAALSFHPVKQITTGEGGAVVSANADLVRRVKRLRAHGVERGGSLAPFPVSGSEREDEAPAPPPPWFAPMEELGLNYRLSDLAAALGTSQLARLPAFQARRRELVERYRRGLAGVPDLELPHDDPGHAWHLYVVHVGAGERDALMEHLAARGIGTQVHYYPVPHQPYFRRRYGEPDCPVALRHARTCLSLPLHARLSDEEHDRVLAALRAWRGR